MKIPIPPTGGQGGHYGFHATNRGSVFETSKGGPASEHVPRRFRHLRLRRRRRSRMSPEHPLMTLFVLAVLAATLGYFLFGVLGRFFE